MAVKGTTAYLDDLSISASDKGLLTVAAGWTMIFFRAWSIGVNLDKSVVLQNVQADRETPLTLWIFGVGRMTTNFWVCQLDIESMRGL